MALSFRDSQPLARVIPIRRVRAGAWQGDLFHFLIANPKHLEWLTERPVICHFVDEVLLDQMIHARAEELTIYHSADRFEVDFRMEGRRHRIAIPNHRWALPVSLRIKRLAGMDMTNPVVWQVGEMSLSEHVRANVWVYPSARSERIVLRPRYGRLGQVA